MSVKYGFKVCRVCLTPEPAVKLTSIFDGRGESADLFQLVSGCSISYDRGKHEALICAKCSVEVKATFDLRENIRRVDSYYFQARREEAEEEDFEREPAAVEDTRAEVVPQDEAKIAPRGSASSSRVRASRSSILGRSGAKTPKAVVASISRQRRSGEDKPKASATAAKPDPVEPFTCSKCPKSFRNNIILKWHQKSCLAS